MHNLLTDHLQPQLEQLAFRLGELRGLALCLPWRRVTGLQPEQVRGLGWAGGSVRLCCNCGVRLQCCEAASILLVWPGCSRQPPHLLKLPSNRRWALPSRPRCA